MQLITHMRLINRALIKEGESAGERLSFMYELVRISESYNIKVRVGTDGGNISGPFIEGMYYKKNPIDKTKVLDITNFWKYLNEINSLLDMYNGIKPYTMLELSVKYSISLNDKTINERTQVGVWYDLESSKPLIKAIDSKVSPMISIDPRHQIRIKEEMVMWSKNQGHIFIPVLENSSNNETEAVNAYGASTVQG